MMTTKIIIKSDSEEKHAEGSNDLERRTGTLQTL